MPFLLENVSHWEEEKDQPFDTNSEEWGSRCGTVCTHKQTRWCYWICVITSHSTFCADHMTRYGERKHMLEIWQQKKQPTPRMKYHRTVEGEILDTTEIRSHFLSRCFVSIQMNKFFKSVPSQPASCRCQHIKCTLKPASNLLSGAVTVCWLGGFAPLNKPIPVLHRQTCSQSVRYGQFENIKVKKWNGEHLIDSRYKNHQ